ncbi:MAG: hypothetical protein KatS3mg114_0028 [Planctomycetaceae bacterium]|nr:MAG: hypothetical protein KatS3mg114_0028 [Planctomycetaceae bacterium]
MGKSLSEYAAWLEARSDLRWPAPPPRKPVRAEPYLKPLPGIRLVLWDLYGTLLRISDGELLFVHPQTIRMEVAWEKTVREFNMWYAMSRKPGAPWQYLGQLYQRVYDELRLAGSGRKGDFTEVHAAVLWRRLLNKLDLEEYRYDETFYGDLEALAEKIAYFFHASLQGCVLEDQAAATLWAIRQAGYYQGIFADGQCFSMTQLLRGIAQQVTLPPLETVLDPSCITLSYQLGVKKPSRSLYEELLARLRHLNLEPSQVVCVSARLSNDLAVARSYGLRTVLYAGDQTSLRADPAELRDPALKPDRLITQIAQLRDILHTP